MATYNCISATKPRKQQSQRTPETSQSTTAQSIRLNLNTPLDNTRNLSSVIAMGLAQRPRTVSLTATAEKKWKTLIHNDDIMASLTTNFLKPADDTETRDSAGNTITINYGDNNAVATWTQISRWLNTLDYC